MSLDDLAAIIKPLTIDQVAALFDQKALERVTLSGQLTQVRAKQNSIRSSRADQDASAENDINSLEQTAADIQKQIDALQ